MKIQQFSKRKQKTIEFGGGPCIALVIALLFLLAFFEPPEFLRGFLEGREFLRAFLFEPLEWLTYDLRFNIRGERDPLSDILIITINEKSQEILQERIPFKRSLHARMIRTLMDHKPSLIVYDLIFDTPTEEAEDEGLANALYDAYDEERDLSLGVLAQYISEERLEQPLEMFADNAGGVGLINLEIDQDDIVRSIRPFFDEVIDPETKTIKRHLCLSLETAALYKGGVNSIDFPQADTITLSRVHNDTSEEVLRVIAPEDKLYINYIGGSGSYPMIPFEKILQGDYKPEDIEGKVIFIGVTALFSHDYFLTPFRNPDQEYIALLKQEFGENVEITEVLSTFGIEIHAHTFQTILENSYIRKVPLLWSTLTIFCIGSLAGMWFFKDHRLIISTASLLLIGGGIFGISLYLFSTHNLWVDLAPLAYVIGINYVAGLGFQRFVAFYNKNKVKGAFEQYVSTAVVDEMLKHPEKLHLGGERKFLTVLFSDIRGFTSISEGMDSQALVEFLNEYLTEMTEIILTYNGMLDKYMGDAIMAIYGAPIEQDDHPVLACSSALDMMIRLKELQSTWRDQGKPPIDIGIGVNSGPMTAGNMGSKKRFDYTVMGDHVNLGSRLEGINKEYGTHIIISEHTYKQVKEQFVTRELDLVRVKGRVEPVKIYELIGRTGQVDANILQGLKHFEEGLTAYREKRWQLAIEKFYQTLNVSPGDPPSKEYITRCQEYQQTPPAENWDGVSIMTTK